MRNPVHAVIKKCGGVSTLATLLNVKYQMVQQWRDAKKFPVKMIFQIEQVTGIPRHELAPELFEGYVKETEVCCKKVMN